MKATMLAAVALVGALPGAAQARAGLIRDADGHVRGFSLHLDTDDEGAIDEDTVDVSDIDVEDAGDIDVEDAGDVRVDLSHRLVAQATPRLRGVPLAPPVPPDAPVPPAPPSPPDVDVSPRLRGQLIGGGTVSLDAEDERVGDVLWELADQAGIDLVMSAPRALLRERVSIKLHERPAAEALEAVLESSHLMADAKGKMVRVRALPGMRVDVDDLVEKVTSKAGKRGVKDPEIVIFGQPLEVKEGDTVQQAVVVGGPLTVRGHVTGDAVSIGGPVLVTASATVDGDVVSIGGPVHVEDGATVKGSKIAMGSGPIADIGSLVASASHGYLTPSVSRFFGIASMLLRYLVLFVMAILLVAFVPDRVQRVRRFLVTRPGASALAGLAMLIGILPLCLLLIVTIIGIPLVPVAVFLLLAFMVMGLTAFMVLLGDRLPILQGRKTPMLEMVLGLAIILLVDLMPVVGTLVVIIASFVAGGAALLSRFGGESKAAGGAGAGTALTAES